MNGNIFYAIQVIIFTFLFMGYLYTVFSKKFRLCDKVERWGCSLLVSFMVTMMVSVLSMSFLEGVYFNAWLLFWFINFSMAAVIAHIEIGIVYVISKKLNQLETAETK